LGEWIAKNKDKSKIWRPNYGGENNVTVVAFKCRRIERGIVFKVSFGHKKAGVFNSGFFD
jgi:hypothetical protein